MSSQNVAHCWVCIFKHQTACFIFLNCERIKASNSFTLASVTGRCPSQMQVASLSTYTTCRWTFSWWLPTEHRTKSPSHCNHRFRFMIPQHTIHIPLSINVVLAPIMARPGNSSSALLEHKFLFSHPSTFTFPSCAFQYGGEVTLKLSTFNVFNLHLQRCKSSYFLWRLITSQVRDVCFLSSTVHCLCSVLLIIINRY